MSGGWEREKSVGWIDNKRQETNEVPHGKQSDTYRMKVFVERVLGDDASRKVGGGDLEGQSNCEETVKG